MHSQMEGRDQNLVHETFNCTDMDIWTFIYKTIKFLSLLFCQVTQNRDFYTWLLILEINLQI